MTGRRFTPDEKASYFAMRDRGWTRRAAADQIGCHYETATTWDSLRSRASGKVSGLSTKGATVRLTEGLDPPDPLEVGKDHLVAEAKRALDDFGYFRRVYLGRVTVPWQVHAAVTIRDALATPDREYLVINCPPGSGKSTMFTHDLICWLLVRNRALRTFIGSRTFRTASTYSNRVRRTLARTRLFTVDEEQVAKGLAVQPERVLALDYGRFKPESADIWRRDEFTIEQLYGQSAEEKEPSVTAWGMDSEFLGNRAGLIVWDDLVTSKLLRTIDQIEQQREWWEDEAETRLEPGGVLLLVGQRMGPEDLYRYSLDMRAVDDEGEETDVPKYRHIIYRSHYEELCEENHSREAPAYDPENPTLGACLLDPRRVPWVGKGGIATIRRNRETKFRVQYQQEDVDPASVLVRKCWIDGGTDEDGSTAPGCWDDRNIGEIPEGLSAPFYRIATCDPSPSKFWAIEDWVYHPETGQRFLVNLVKQVMTAPEFLDCNRGVYSGLMDEWQKSSVTSGYPINYWIIENNAAQRWLLQYGWMQDWMRANQVRVIAHNTNVSNKLDEDFGIQSLRDVYKFGQVRLPAGNTKSGGRIARDLSRQASLKLVDEATRYPDGSTDDCLMAQWFLEFHIAKRTFMHQRDPDARTAWRPSWMRQKVAA